MYYKNRGSLRIVLVGGGLLGLVIVVAIMVSLQTKSAETSVKTGQDIKKTIKEKIQKPLDDRGQMYNRIMGGSFDVILQDAGERKIEVIKVIRSLKKVGLGEAEELVESAPAAVLTGMTKIEAQNAKTQLELVGATVTIDKRKD